MAKILIVDDDQNVRHLIKILLNENGYDTAEASNGLEALELFKNQFLDLIITDLRMPDMDGMAFLIEAKKREPETPVIILTAYASIETAIAALKNGVFNYMSKPFKSDDLLHAVKNALGEEKQKKLP